VREEWTMDEAFLHHYGLGVERDRLIAGGDHLELVRTFELGGRWREYRLLDIGGGPGE
jgi:hypothetical protein